MTVDNNESCQLGVVFFHGHIASSAVASYRERSVHTALAVHITSKLSFDPSAWIVTFFWIPFPFPFQALSCAAWPFFKISTIRSVAVDSPHTRHEVAVTTIDVTLGDSGTDPLLFLPEPP
jgi:hypothetical protein